MHDPLALDDLQMRILRRAAASLPATRRDIFLRQVAGQLRGRPSTPALEAAIDCALQKARPVLDAGS